jgi:hypothetical protein
MVKNFTVANSVGISVGTCHCDLHNEFHVSQIAIDFEHRALTISLVQAWGIQPDTQARRLQLRFVDVDFVRLSEGAMNGSTRGVDELGYKNPTDFDHDWLIDESRASAADHLFLRLNNDEFVRVHSRIAVATAIG